MRFFLLFSVVVVWSGAFSQGLVRVRVSEGLGRGEEPYDIVAKHLKSSITLLVMQCF